MLVDFALGSIMPEPGIDDNLVNKDIVHVVNSLNDQKLQYI